MTNSIDLQVLYNIAKLFKVLPIKPNQSDTDDPDLETEDDSTVLEDLKADIIEAVQDQPVDWPTLVDISAEVQDVVGSLLDEFDYDLYVKQPILDAMDSLNWPSFVFNASLVGDGVLSWFASILNKNSDLLGAGLSYTVGDGKLNVTVGSLINYNDYFTIEIAIYRAIRMVRNAFQQAASAGIDFINDVLEDVTQIFFPLPSGAGIKIAEKINDEWIVDNSSPWPDTYDPAVIQLYFKLPVLPMFDFFHIHIAKTDITQNNIWFKNSGTWSQSRKYTNLDLCIDIFWIIAMIIISYLLTKIKIGQMNEHFVSKALDAPTILKPEVINMTQTITYNKNLFSYMGGIISIFGSFIGTSSNLLAFKAWLNANTIPEIPDFSFPGTDIDLEAITTALDDIKDNIDTDSDIGNLVSTLISKIDSLPKHRMYG